MKQNIPLQNLVLFNSSNNDKLQVSKYAIQHDFFSFVNYLLDDPIWITQNFVTQNTFLCSSYTRRTVYANCATTEYDHVSWSFTNTLPQKKQKAYFYNSII